MKDSYKHKGLRKKLVEMLIKKGISDPRVLAAIDTVPRHFFTGKDFEEFAYEDKALPIGEDQTISQPYTVAYQSQLLEVSKGSKVLELGTGSGYQTAILATLGASIYTIERKELLYKKAVALFSTLGIPAHCFLGDGSVGLPQHAPFDRIIVTAGAPNIPQTLVDQLANGGIMIIPVGNDQEQKMIKMTKGMDGKVTQHVLDSFRFVPLVGENAW